MERRTATWSLRLIAALFGAALLFATGPGLGEYAYAKSDKGKKEAKAEAPKPPPKETRAQPAARGGSQSSPARDSRGISKGSGGLLDRVRGRLEESRRPDNSAPPSRPSIRLPEIGRFQTRPDRIENPRPSSPPVTPPSRSSRHELSDLVPWLGERGSSSVTRPSPTEPGRPGGTTTGPPADRGSRHELGDLVPWLGGRGSSSVTRPSPTQPDNTRPSRGDREAATPPRATPPAAREPEARPGPQGPMRSGNRLLRPKPEAELPSKPAVVPGHEQRPVGPAPSILRRPGKGGGDVIPRHFDRVDQPRVDDARRPLSPVPDRTSYFHRIRDRHPAQVDRPLHISYFTALHRLQARRYYRTYYYHCVPYYYPYDYWYAHYYVHYYYPCYYGRPYVVISFPIFIERYHRVDCCPRDDSRVWYYYDRECDGYDCRYPYLTNYPGTLGRALRDIQRAWYDEEINYLFRHVDQREPIKIYRGNRYTHDLQPSEFVDLTLDAFDQSETDRFRYTEIERIWGGGWARVHAEHVFWDADGESRKIYLSFLLERVRGRSGEEWVLREIRQDSRPF